MARYNREFLVPYLQNICALHLFERKLRKKQAQIRNRIDVLKRGQSNSRPREYKPNPLYTPGRIVSLLIGCFWVFMLISSGFAFADRLDDQSIISIIILMYLIFGGLAFAFIGGAIYYIIQEKKSNERELEKYKQRVAEYDRIETSNENARKQIPDLQKKLNACTKELSNVRNMLQNAYNANVIPSHYRGIYPAVFLYEWFSTGREDDVGFALSMFVLEEIKARLDRIIENQSEMILNQRMMLANQQRAVEQQEEHSRLMRAKIANLQVSVEEQNQYISMMESTDAGTVYFADGEYIRKLF